MESSTIEVVVIDDHPVVSVGLAASGQRIKVVAAFNTVETFLRGPVPDHDVVVLDLQLHAAQGFKTETSLEGTAAIRAIVTAGHGPVVVYTTLSSDMLLAACLAAGAMGAATKSSPIPVLREVLDLARQHRTWVDPAVAGALRRLADGKHAGALSQQQSSALQWRAQGLRQRAIAERIGVKDEETVHRYLSAAIEKLAVLDEDDEPGLHPGARVDRLAERTGLAARLVRLVDIQRPSRSTRRRPR